MTEVAALNIKVTTDQVKGASADLKVLVEVSQKVEKQTESQKTATDRLQSSLLQLRSIVRDVAAAYGAYKVAEYIKDSALLAARYETLGVTMHKAGANAGYTKGEMDALEASLRKQGIAGVEARQTLTKLAASHMDLGKASEMARAAQDLAVVAGINSSEAFERLVQGIQSGQAETLRTLGINVNFEKSYKDLAKQLKVNVEQLTESEKMQARMNATLDAARGYAGLYESAMDTAGKQITSMKRYVDDLAVSFGSAFNESTASIVKDMTAGIKELSVTVKDPAFVLGVSGIGDFGAKLFGAITVSGTSAVQVLGNTMARISGIFIMVDAFINRHQADMDTGWKIVTSGDPAKALQMAGARARDRALTYGATPTGNVISPGALEAEYNIQHPNKAPEKRELSQAQIDKARHATESISVDLAKANDVADESTGKIAELKKKYDEYALVLGKTNPLVLQFAVLLGYARTHLGNTPAEVHKATEEVLKHTRAMQGEIDALQAVAGLYGEDYSDRLTMLRAETAAQEQYNEAIKKGVSIQNAAAEKSVALAKAQAEITARKQQGAKGIAAGFAGDSYEAQRREIIASYEEAKNYTNDRVALEAELQSKLAALESARLKKTESGTDGMKAALLDYSESVGTASSRMATLWNSGFKSMEDALSNFVGNGEINLVSLFKTIRTEIARTQVVQPFLGSISSGSLWGGLTKMFGFNHGGGMVGDPTFSRSLSPFVFAGAPRFHGGGWPGLAPDEVPIIAQKGERVLSKDEVAAGAGTSGPITVKLVNQSGQQLKASTAKVTQDSQGTLVEVILDAAARDVGGFRTGMQAALGVR